MKKYKQILLTYFSIIIGSFALLLPAYYIYDPMQIFHKAWDREVTFSKNMRQQVAGIINSYDDYDSVIIGTSMVENTSAKEASKQLGGKFINISLAGSSYYERAIVLHSLFRLHKIKTVLYSLDVDKYLQQKKEYPHYPLSNFDYLYDNIFWNDFRIYFNNKYLSCLFLFSKSEECVGRKTTLDKPNAWYDEEGNKERFGGLDNWISYKDHPYTAASFKTISETVKHIKNKEKQSLKDLDTIINKAEVYIDKNILSLVKMEPDTQFILFDPPYSRIQYAIWAQYDLVKFEVYKAILIYLARKSDEFSNLEVYSFGEEKFMDNIATYMDLGHYHPSINSWMLSQMTQKKGLLSEKSIDKYIEDITRKAMNYNLIELNNNIRNKLKTDP